MTRRLSKDEVSRGIERLTGREFALQGMAWLGDLTGSFVHEAAHGAFHGLTKDHAIDGATADVVTDLAMALLASRLTPEETLRLGTSPAALDLFERTSQEWNRLRARVGSNVAPFRPRKD